ncbi:MAG: hypothetical protein DHS20C17_36240 [Cyclobacteriaceae bacterium]|nr:MAG: hypothetical protein DHS20C17_36240 [Cyclobacteriaceae bacterium]
MGLAGRESLELLIHINLNGYILYPEYKLVPVKQRSGEAGSNRGSLGAG